MRRAKQRHQPAARGLGKLRNKHNNSQYKTWDTDYLYVEFSPSTEFLCNIADTPQDSQAFLELRDLLQTKILKSLEILTEHQRDIVDLYYFEGLTQAEVAKRLGINQPSVSLAINGGDTYKDGVYVCTYGGIRSKLYRHLMKDPEVRQALAAIAEELCV